MVAIRTMSSAAAVLVLNIEFAYLELIIGVEKENRVSGFKLSRGGICY
jgi:hypothetical protein